MKKLVISSAVALALAGSLAVAEESGAFVGVGVGYGSAKYTFDIAPVQNSTDGSGIRYEAVLGYKQFFTDSFGLRYYGNFSYGDHAFKLGNNDLKSNVMNYGINVDALYNFVASSNTNLGVFLGVGVGANTWSGKAVDGVKEAVRDTKISSTGIDAALNVGLRGVFARRHSLELAARVPFMATTLVDKTDGTLIKATLKPTYSAGVRYIFSF